MNPEGSPTTRSSLFQTGAATPTPHPPRQGALSPCPPPRAPLFAPTSHLTPGNQAHRPCCSHQSSHLEHRRHKARTTPPTDQIPLSTAPCWGWDCDQGEENNSPSHAQGQWVEVGPGVDAPLPPRPRMVIFKHSAGRGLKQQKVGRQIKAKGGGALKCSQEIRHGDDRRVGEGL